MKKVLILQNIGNTYGGVWQVNRLIGEELIKHNYDVSIVSIRNVKNNIVLEHDAKLHLYTINENDTWGTYSGQEILAKLKDIRPLKAIQMLIDKIKYNINIKDDINKLHKYIEEYKPNYIITSHYELISMIPNEFLNITIHEQHSSLEFAFNHKGTKKVFEKYKDKIKFIFLTKQAELYAKKIGIDNWTYIYNPVRFESKRVADVKNSKKLITIARLSQEKNIDGMVRIVKDIFKDKQFKDWTLEIYGDGEEYQRIVAEINNHPQIKLMGLTNNPKEKLLTAAINLNTSPYEGFCLSILEANECGVPTITFNFGESVTEEIIDGETGLVANDYDDYIDKLKMLMRDKDKLFELAKNCKEFNKQFQVEEIIKKWLELFKDIDNGGNI